MKYNSKQEKLLSSILGVISIIILCSIVVITDHYKNVKPEMEQNAPVSQLQAIEGYKAYIMYCDSINKDKGEYKNICIKD